MIQEFIQAFLLIFIAEMGDKTQILAMAFSTKFPVKKVLLGIFIGSLLNHGLAVILGNYLANIVPMQTVQIIAGAAFIGFALWTLISEDEDEKTKESKHKFGAIVTVAMAFFIGELGDKTQLTAITLGSAAVYPIIILAGTVSGMIVTGGIGIWVGKKLGNKIPEFVMKIVASSVFLVFGIIKLYQSLPQQFINTPNIIIFSSVLSIAVFLLLLTQLKKRRQGIQSAYLVQSQELYDYYHGMKEDLNNICLGKENCKNCIGNDCIIGYTKDMLNNINELKLKQNEYIPNEAAMNKQFSQDNTIDSLVKTLIVLKVNRSNTSYKRVHDVRKQLELILFKKSITMYKNIKSYMNKVGKINPELADVIYKKYNDLSVLDSNNKIMNLGNRVNNIYLIKNGKSYLLIDTGYPEHYAGFTKQLNKLNIKPKDISYVFLTHAHDDHVGFLNEILKESNAKVILHKDAVRRLSIGQNSFDGGCTSKVALVACKIMKLFGKGEHKFKPVNQPDRYLIINDENKSRIEKDISGKIVELPGHTSDSIGYLSNEGILFCGDAAMNGIPSVNNITIWLEKLDDYYNSWKKIIEVKPVAIYPTHGKPFGYYKLSKNISKVNNVRLYALS